MLQKKWYKAVSELHMYNGIKNVHMKSMTLLNFRMLVDQFKQLNVKFTKSVPM